MKEIEIAFDNLIADAVKSMKIRDSMSSSISGEVPEVAIRPARSRPGADQADTPYLSDLFFTKRKRCAGPGLSSGNPTDIMRLGSADVKNHVSPGAAFTVRVPCAPRILPSCWSNSKKVMS